MSELAILGGPRTRTEPYPEWPVWDQRDIDAVTEVIKSGRWGGYPYPGPKTAELAKKFAEMQGGGYAVPMANGTVTMEVALRAAGIGWGDEVIVPAYTFQATASAPMAAGAIPVIVDVDPDNYCIDPGQVEKAITPKTRAIIPVHLGSNMADMDAIMALAEKHNLIVIEDCAAAQGRSVTSARSRSNRRRLSPLAKAASCYVVRPSSPRKLPQLSTAGARTHWVEARKITPRNFKSAATSG
jgi:L-glutamine:2-deoxy-scyllo-inosose/3-amino-2,3-dideoxy-scyllo-inosose aminotransferase